MQSFISDITEKKKAKTKAKKEPVKRDKNIEKAAGRELNLGTSSIPSKKNYNRKEKHKGKSMNSKFDENDFISEDVQSKLETMAGVKTSSYTMTDRGIKFTFENSLQANQCQIIKYHDRFIIEFRKKTDSIMEGKMDQLVFEDVIKPAEFQQVFENVTGIYLSFLGL